MTDAAAPLVSIVIPAYKPDFIEAALDSALRQSYPSIEIVVSDNCPDEGVARVMRDYPRVRYQRNPVRGVYPNFRNCIRLASGEYVKFLLDDDLLMPSCVADMVEVFNHVPEVTLVSGWYRLVDEHGRELELRRLQADRLVVSSVGGAAASMLMWAKNPLGPLTTSMFRRRSLPLGMGPWFFHGGAPQRYFGLMDMAIILDLAFLGRVATIPKALSAMRVHPAQLSNPETNPRAIGTVTSWLPLAEDAHAFGLIDDDQLQHALVEILAQFGRFRRRFPVLEQDMARLQQRLRQAGA